MASAITRRLRVSAIVAALAATFGFAGPPGIDAHLAGVTNLEPSIVVLRDESGDPRVVAAEHGRQHGFAPGFIYTNALKGYAASLPPSALAALAADPRVLSVSPDRELHAAAPPTACIDLTTCQRISLGVDRIDGDLSSTRSGDGKGFVNVNVAVLDSGIGPHPDLNVVGGVDCTRNGDGSFDDVLGHGTLVAGFIGALDNGFGRVGIAPGARLWSVRILRENNLATVGEELCGFDWIAGTRTDADPTNDIAVANMSVLGPVPHADDGNCGRTKPDAEHLALCNAVAEGVTFVVAAGNDAKDIQDYAPAAYDEVLTATAMADFDGKSGGLGTNPEFCATEGSDNSATTFSNFATLAADRAHTLAAPGSCLGSTYLNDGYAIASGTSFASPIVAGVVALCLGSGSKPCLGLSPAQIVQKVVRDANDYNTAKKNIGYGFLGDPNHEFVDRYFGYLARAGLY